MEFRELISGFATKFGIEGLDALQEPRDPCVTFLRHVCIQGGSLELRAWSWELKVEKGA